MVQLEGFGCSFSNVNRISQYYGFSQKFDSRLLNFLLFLFKRLTQKLAYRENRFNEVHNIKLLKIFQ